MGGKYSPLRKSTCTVLYKTESYGWSNFGFFVAVCLCCCCLFCFLFVFFFRIRRRSLPWRTGNYVQIRQLEFHPDGWRCKTERLDFKLQSNSRISTRCPHMRTTRQLIAFNQFEDENPAVTCPSKNCPWRGLTSISAWTGIHKTAQGNVSSILHSAQGNISNIHKRPQGKTQQTRLWC